MATEALHMHKDRLSAEGLDLKDPHVSSSLALFAIHNVIRRNLQACAEHATTVQPANIDAFTTYAKYTLHVLRDQLTSIDEIWFPVFAEHDPRFLTQKDAHDALYQKLTVLEAQLATSPAELEGNQPLSTEIAGAFAELHDLTDRQYDLEEDLVNQLGRKVPIETIRALEKKQEERRRADVKVYGHLWTAVYLLRGLEPKERAIFPPGIPKLIVGGMLTAGAMQFRRELQFTPRF
ncbi:xanthocillin biosynthesis cluster protein xanF [Aspergillus novofumigatus IBT 16806]|uniref:Hemerythrin-like domain-containing protein n=1 Tax=Aspergillus novofumigatus (strain IBT 16806) TaxID=1392255 RepID=A0A2I1CFZ1_ASPN1|nr:uncharacterized protein P174DRAFT_448309 [Aspergillus novofumigatus IBT 16806]PKX96553.1 hypothetical protein P174DRAFT_448309 [Aspergillus novofumigatus IBT 16806]